MADKPTVAWDETNPANTADAGEGDDRIRGMKTQLREVVAQDHGFPAAGKAESTGYHKIIHLPVLAEPTAIADVVQVYAKDVDAKAELHVHDEDSDEIQLTVNGFLNCVVENRVSDPAAPATGQVWLRTDL